MAGNMILEGWQEQIKAAAARRSQVTIAGSGSKRCYLGAQPVVTDCVDCRAYEGVVEYEPNELVIVVRCGTSMLEVERVMAEAGQMLAFEPPHFGPAATIGGVVATGLSGPRRPYAGAVRDFVLGVRMIDGKGDDLRFGGKVMKNVAGFDVSRLLVGSLGSLGVISEVAFKCLPLPNSQQTRRYTVDAEQAIEWMNHWYAQAQPITASTWVDGNLYVRFAGAEPAVLSAVTRLGGERLADDDNWWADWREQRHSFFTGEAALLRVSCKSTAPFSAFAIGDSQQAIDWGGAQRWLRLNYLSDDELSQLQQLKTIAAVHGGHVFVYGSGDFALASLSAPLLTVEAGIKAQFDPYHILPALPGLPVVTVS